MPPLGDITSNVEGGDPSAEEKAVRAKVNGAGSEPRAGKGASKKPLSHYTKPLMQKIDSLRSALKEVDPEELSSADSPNDEGVANAKSKIERFEKQVDTLVDLEEQVSDAKSDADGWRNEVQAVADEVVSLRSELEDAHSCMAKLQEVLGSTSTREAHLENEVNDANEEIASVKKRNEHLLKQLSEAKAEAESSRSAHAQLRSELAGAKQESDALKRQLDEQKEMTARYEKELFDAQVIAEKAQGNCARCRSDTSEQSMRNAGSKTKTFGGCVASAAALLAAIFGFKTSGSKVQAERDTNGPGYPSRSQES
jgi:chromosome segregation ATPase